MARIGQISEAQQRINQSRDELAKAIRAFYPDASYIQVEDLLAALEKFINAKMVP